MTVNIKADPLFEKWAIGYSGCYGGDVSGKFWLSGIEYGGGTSENELVFNDSSVPPTKSEPEYLKYPYGQKAAKLYTAMLGKDMTDYKKIATEQRYFSADSGSFMMNLYPISFRKDQDELWEEWLYKKTGLPTKSIYCAWCQMNRFKAITERVIKYSPEIIVGTGLSRKDDFIMAFGGIENLYENEKELQSIKIMDKQMYYLPVNNGRTMLFITPFLGSSGGLNSDALLSEFGKQIRQISTAIP